MGDKVINEEEIKLTAKQLLKDIGIKIHFLGFKYWITALVISLKHDEETEENLTMMTLYSLVAKKHRTTTSKTERAMRYAYSGLDLKNYFNVSYSINNTALLFLLKDKIQEKYYEKHITCINPFPNTSGFDLTTLQKNHKQHKCFL